MDSLRAHAISHYVIQPNPDYPEPNLNSIKRNKGIYIWNSGTHKGQNKKPDFLSSRFLFFPFSPLLKTSRH
jgi:hypothetical protein